MKTIYNIFYFQRSTWLLFMALFFTVSCSDDFLKDELLSDTSVEFLYTTPEGLEAAVVGLYTLNRPSNTSGKKRSSRGCYR
jgi:hypothetical protein